MCLTDAVVSEQPAGSESEPAPIHNNVGLEELNKTDRLLVQQVGHHHHWHQHHRPNTQNCWDSLEFSIKTSQELRMLSSVAINCQVAKIVINPGSQLSVL